MSALSDKTFSSAFPFTVTYAFRATIAHRHNGKQHGTTQHFIRGLWEANWVLAPAQSWKRWKDLEKTAGNELSVCNSRDT